MPTIERASFTGMSMIGNEEHIKQNYLLRLEIEAFQQREILLLQEGQYLEWIRLFAPELHYWMPVVSIRQKRAEMVSTERQLAYFDDTLETLSIRVQRALNERAHTEAPPSRTRYFIENLKIEAHTQTPAVSVTSNILVYQTRLEKEENFFAGGREDILRKVNNTDWKIVNRKVVMDRSILGAKNLSIFF